VTLRAENRHFFPMRSDPLAPFRGKGILWLISPKREASFLYGRLSPAKSMVQILFLLLFFLPVSAMFSQSHGDYRSITGPPARIWSEPSNWEIYDSLFSIWKEAVVVPGTSSKVTIREESPVYRLDIDAEIGELVVTGILEFNEGTGFCLKVNRNLGGTGSLDLNRGSDSHTLILKGENNDIGNFSSNFESFVNYSKEGDQQIFASLDYANLLISGGGTKTLSGITKVSGELSMEGGNINTGGNILELGTEIAIPGMLHHISGNIIGKLKRWITIKDESYLYPVGTDSIGNHAILAFTQLPDGPVMVEFIGADPGNSGLPVNDVFDGLPISTHYPDGYWIVTTTDSFTTPLFNLTLNAAGFTNINPSSRIIRRDQTYSWSTEGYPLEPLGNIFRRNTLSAELATEHTHFGIGKAEVVLTQQPSSVHDACPGSNIELKVSVSGGGTLSYQWYKLAYDSLLTDVAKYSGVNGPELIIHDFSPEDAAEYYCIVSDEHSSIRSDNADVTLDGIDPLIDCPVGNQTTGTDPGICTYTHSGTGWDASGTDNCSVASIAYVLAGETTGTGTSLDWVAFSTGVTTVTWTVTDGSGNTGECFFTVTVEDNTQPTFTVPADITIYKDAGCSYDADPSITGEPTSVLDNCDPSPTASYSDVVNAGACAGELNITRTWRVEDDCGNFLEQDQVITVEDTTAPTVDHLPGDLERTLECSDPAALAAALALEPAFTDNCDSNPVTNLVYNVSTQVMDGSCGQFGYTITRRWTATDACGNVSLEYQQVITVEDTTAPAVDHLPGELDRTVWSALIPQHWPRHWPWSLPLQITATATR
jgi:hypothetical protein